MSSRDLSVEIGKLADEMINEGSFYVLPDEGKVRPNRSHINNRFCGILASRLLEVLGEGELVEKEFKGIPHSFVLYQGHYYDSEAPCGVKSWKDLPIFSES